MAIAAARMKKEDGQSPVITEKHRSQATQPKMVPPKEPYTLFLERSILHLMEDPHPNPLPEGEGESLRAGTGACPYVGMIES